MTHSHDGGLAQDMALMTRRRLIGGVALAGLAGVSAWLLGGASQAEPTLATTGPDGATCVKAPAETAGPFPADGTNVKDGQTVNALTQSGVVRTDLRPSFAGLEGLAEGVPLELEITLVNVGDACAPLAGHAIYLWHADAEGRYSLYDLPDQNYLRGVVMTDAEGRATLTTILPGCYDGRWPHIHFEIFASLEAAVSGKAALLTSQFALPEAPIAAAYAADSHYPESEDNLTRVSLTRDMVFRDNTPEQVAAQTVSLTGDAAAGFAGVVTVGVVV